MSGTGRTHRAAVEYADVVACLTEIKTLMDNRWEPGVRLEVLADFLLPQAECDPEAFQDAVVQILSNACEAMPDGGLVTLEVVATNGRPIPFIEIHVRDSGIGMSRDMVDHAFDLFFTTKGRGLGGFGLHSVSRFAEDHGGNVEIRSRPGSGTTVTLRLPAAASPAGAGLPLPGGDPEFTGSVA